MRAIELAAQVKAGRVFQAHTLFHVPVRLAQLVSPLQLGQLHRAVDACHLQRVGNLVGHHGHTVGHGELDHVGQVVLALGVLVVQPGQPGFEQACGHSHDAAVHLADGTLGFAGVFVFDDGLHRITLATTTHDAAIPRGVGKVDGEQRQLVCAALSDQRLQGIRLSQRHIARQNHHHPIIGQRGHGLLHGVAGAQLRLLAHALDGQRLARGQQQRLDLVSPVAGDDHRRAGVQLRCCVQYMLHQRHPGQALQHLGQAAFHAGAFASSHDDNVDGEDGGGHGEHTFSFGHRWGAVFARG